MLEYSMMYLLLIAALLTGCAAAPRCPVDRVCAAKKPERVLLMPQGSGFIMDGTGEAPLVLRNSSGNIIWIMPYDGGELGQSVIDRSRGRD